jgi:hypothetical protein
MFVSGKLHELMLYALERKKPLPRNRLRWLPFGSIFAVMKNNFVKFPTSMKSLPRLVLLCAR